MYTIAICDDEVTYIKEMKSMVAECVGDEYEVTFLEYHSGEELLQSIPMEANVVIMDIQMDGMNGNEAAVKLKESGYRGILVQCSGIYAPTPETIVLSPYRYIQKQDSCEKNMVVMHEVLHEMVKRNSYTNLLVQYGQEQIIIPVRDIAYLTRHRRGSEVILENEEKRKQYPEFKLVCLHTLEELWEKLHNAGFTFPHNSYLVNLRYVSSMSKKADTITIGNHTLTIARSKKDEFSREFMKYIENKY